MRSSSGFDGHSSNPLNILPYVFRYAWVTDRLRAGEAAERLLIKVAAESSQEDAVRALLATAEDACLVYTNSATGTRLAAAVANDSTAAAKLRACIGQDAPRYVVETIVTGVPRRFVFRGANDRASRGIGLDDWPAALVVTPRYGLVTSIEAAGNGCGALVMLRCRPACRPYSDFDVDVFRLIGLRVSSRVCG